MREGGGPLFFDRDEKKYSETRKNKAGEREKGEGAPEKTQSLVVVL